MTDADRCPSCEAERPANSPEGLRRRSSGADPARPARNPIKTLRNEPISADSGPFSDMSRAARSLSSVPGGRANAQFEFFSESFKHQSNRDLRR
jgi:hypothetical protein